MTESSTFQRVILGIRHNVPREGLRQAVDLATLLGVELRGLFFKEDELGCLAGFPFVREFRPLEGSWCSIQHSEIADAIDGIARNAERTFREAAKALNRPSAFEIILGSMAEMVGSVSRAGDIVVVPEPESPAECVTPQFVAAVEAALGSAASVMLIPSGAIRDKGPVVAAATAPDDPCIEVASEIAALAKGQLSIIDRAKLLGGVCAGEPLGTGSTTQDRGIATTQATGSLRPRLIVMTRGKFEISVAGLITSIRRVPVLVVEPKSDQGVKQ